MRSRRRGRGIRRLLTASLAVVLVVGLAVGGYFLAGYLKMTRDAVPIVTPSATSTPGPTGGEGTPAPSAEPTLIDKAGLERDLRVPIETVAQRDPDVQNILLIGVDRRNTSSTTGNSDTMMILSIDRRNKTLKLISILRDCFVTLQKDGKTVKGKINAAYAYGGPGLTINTLNKTFDLDIQKYVLVDFQSAEQVITAAGGLTLDIHEAEIEFINQSIRETNERILPDTPASPLVTKAGLQPLDARQVISYARIRKVDLVVGDKTYPMDMGRVERQKIVLRGLMGEFFEADLLQKTGFLSSVFDMVETNLRLSDAWSLMRFAAGEMAPDTSASAIKGFTIPSASTRTVIESPVWCFVVDFNRAIPELQQFIWGKNFDFTPRDSVSP